MDKDETCREFDSDSNIFEFEVEAENNKEERPNAEEYRLTIWETDRFWISFDD